MKSLRDTGSIPLPTALLAEVEAAAQEEHRPVSDVVRDFVEQGLNKRRWKQQAAAEQVRARAFGLPDDDTIPTEAYRQTFHAKIAQGLQSLSEGKRTDGDSFMAAIDAELAALEQQQRK